MSDESDIRIVELKPTRVASYRAVSKNPELDAINVIIEWANKEGLSKENSPRLFGFNNPGPQPGQSEYGYEVWLTVGLEVKASGEVIIRDFDGGLYAVKKTNLNEIGRNWKDIVKWRESSKYTSGRHQCLEELLNPATDMSPDSIIIDLYLPIEKK